LGQVLQQALQAQPGQGLVINNQQAHGAHPNA
jgi:hypothetical protein